jgi:hypothetical protein
MRKIPAYVASSEREYKRTKRRQWMIVVRSRLIGRERPASWWIHFQTSCAFIPREALIRLGRINTLLKEIDEILEEWWKND